MEPEGRRLVSLQFFLPVYGVRDKPFASSLSGECPPRCRDCLSVWDWLWMAKTQLWNLRELPFPFSQVHVFQGGILRILPWHQAGGIWSQAPGFGKHCLLDQRESCQGKQEFVSGFLCYEKQVVQFQPSLRQPSKTMGSAQEHPWPWQEPIPVSGWVFGAPAPAFPGNILPLHPHQMCPEGFALCFLSAPQPSVMIQVF